jgi:hypothetical protein
MKWPFIKENPSLHRKIEIFKKQQNETDHNKKTKNKSIIEKPRKPLPIARLSKKPSMRGRSQQR